MALEVRWYDCLCFAIVVGAVIGSLWVILSREGGRGQRRSDQTILESLLLVAAPDGEDGVGTVQGIGHVGNAQLWMSCWPGLNPAWLLGLRLVAMVAMIGVLSWDMMTYDSSILLYYTEYGILKPFFVVVAVDIINYTTMVSFISCDLVC